MTEKNNVRGKIINQLCQYIDKKLSPDLAALLKKFARDYYQAVPFHDLENIAIEDLYGALLSHWNLALYRKDNEDKINIYNPDLENHGWQSQHTIVEIVTRDMPFLLQSISMEINQQGLTNHLVIHPVFCFKRDQQRGELLEILDAEDNDCCLECLLHLEIDRQTDDSKLNFLKKRLKVILTDVRAATEDWKACLDKMNLVIEGLKGQPGIDDEEIEFLKWLGEDHFVFLGYREYKLVSQQDKKAFQPVPETGLGILRDSLAKISADHLQILSPEAFAKINTPDVLMITKATSRSTVHRPVFMDYIGVKQFSRQGELIGEKRFLGLYNSSAYLTELKNIPLVRRKISQIIQRFSFRKGSHQARTLLFILQTLPRDEVFQSDVEGLFNCAQGVMQLQERQHVKVFIRHDVYSHFVSLLVFVPRERYHTSSRKKIQKIFLEIFKARHVDFSVQLSESILARIHFIIQTDGCQCIDFDVKDIEQKIISALAEWNDDLKQELVNYHGEARANELFNLYKDAFSAAYQEDVSARTAILDIDRLEHLLASEAETETLLYSPLTASTHKSLRFKIFSKQQVSLSKSLPMLENMGVKVCDERPYEIRKKDCNTSLWIHDFGLQTDMETRQINLDNLKPQFQETFEHCWMGRFDNDGFNQLIIKAFISWQQINIFRGFYLYLRQIGIAFSQSYVETTLANNPDVVRLLIQYFNQRFDPSIEQSENSDKALAETITQAIDKVQSLDEDRILRRYLNLIQSAVRTNYFLEAQDEQGIPYFSIKFDSSLIQGIPRPVPYVEVFVYSPRVEAIHLRGGPVARGGLRWSDRREDFRTEILGLMKAQMTKNAVIVPTGAKGGFVVKKLGQLNDRESRNKEVISCYQIFIRGLLDLTDNLQNGQVVKPEKVNCYDGDDTYLVVAADKGTARFSDYANALSLQYGFWLGDAFASGGSNGYDHKKMGITARGAWESVKHHFTHLAIDYLNKPFTVVGIGGMSGDVFGNGMLLSNKIKLIAVFDHQHIFLDPDPDTEKSFQERKRLFEKTAASWADYNPTLISKGGGVYLRTAKSIQLSPAVKERLNINKDRLTPNELIKCILTAPVDLLWNGGIGTYVKAEWETSQDVGDRANDAVRVNGKEVRCKVVAEGGNLGFTQAGRIEYAQVGGRINTDSIDNSAGVDCSDHEVNIKILLDSIVASGDLTEKQRNELLVLMTDEVSQLVLKNNALQNKAISSIEKTARTDIQGVLQVIDILEKEGHLDRKIEVIPTHEQLIRRSNQGAGLYRPEISVLLAYTKQMLKRRLSADLTELKEKLLKHELLQYFPERLQQQFADSINQHYLAQDIVVNCLINSYVNRMGIIFPQRIQQQNNFPLSVVVTVYKKICHIFSVQNQWTNIELLQNQINASTTEELYGYIRRLIERGMNWYLSNMNKSTVQDSDIDDYSEGIEQLKLLLPGILPESINHEIDTEVELLIKQGVPSSLALEVVITDIEYLCLDVIWLNKQTGHSLESCAKVFFELIDSLDLLWLREQIQLLPQKSLWQSLARRTCREEFNSLSCGLTFSVLQQSGTTAGEKLENWCHQLSIPIERYKRLLTSVKADESIELEKITVLLKELQDIGSSK